MTSPEEPTFFSVNNNNKNNDNNNNNNNNNNNSSSNNSKKKTPKIVRSFLIFSRWLFILGCAGFVCWGWYNSGCKFLLAQTSVGITVNETDTFIYPSVTFCYMFKDSVNLVDTIAAAAKARNITDVTQLDLNGIIANISYKRTDFLSSFVHSEDGNQYYDVLHNDSHWKSFIPHPQQSGVCYTYDPTFESSSAPGHGIRFGLVMPGSKGKTDLQKEEMLSLLRVYLHDKGSFIFYQQDDRPSCSMLDLSWFQLNRTIPISLKFSRFTRLSRPGSRCTDDPGYNFNECLEKTYSQWRGCQPPWYYDDKFDIPICTNVSAITTLIRQGNSADLSYADWTRPDWSTAGLSSHSECPVPCTSSTYETELSFDKPSSNPLDKGSDWVVYLYFKNFQFEYDEEYIVCDWTCLLGEIGGNLGFFLGGSVITYIDFLLNPMQYVIESKMVKAN